MDRHFLNWNRKVIVKLIKLLQIDLDLYIIKKLKIKMAFVWKKGRNLIDFRFTKDIGELQINNLINSPKNYMIRLKLFL